MNLSTTIGNMFGKKRRIALPVHMYPQREWIVGIGIGICFLAAGLVYAALFFKSQIDDRGDTVSEVGGIVDYKEALVLKVVSIYRTRATQFEILRTGEHQGSVSPVVNTALGNVEGGAASLNAE